MYICVIVLLKQTEMSAGMEIEPLKILISKYIIISKHQCSTNYILKFLIIQNSFIMSFVFGIRLHYKLLQLITFSNLNSYNN